MSKSLQTNKNYEEYAFILDTYSKNGKSCAQAIGEKYFWILELELQPLETPEKLLNKRVYVGKTKEREHVRLVIGKIPSEKVSEKAKIHLDSLVYNIVRDELPSERSENRYLTFLNFASNRGLRLLGLDKHHRVSLIMERDRRLPNRFPTMFEATHSMNCPHAKQMGLADFAILFKNRIMSEIRSTNEDHFSIRAFLSDPQGYIKAHGAYF